jgi:hypothetical protein
MCATRNSEPDCRTTNLKDLTMCNFLEVQWYMPPTELFPPVMGMEGDACLGLETDWELPQLPWNADLASLDCDWVGQLSHGTEFVQRPLNSSSDLTSTDNRIDNSFGPLNVGTQRAGYFQLYTHPECRGRSAASVSAFGIALSSESSISTQGY